MRVATELLLSLPADAALRDVSLQAWRYYLRPISTTTYASLYWYYGTESPTRAREQGGLPEGVVETSDLAILMAMGMALGW